MEPILFRAEPVSITHKTGHKIYNFNIGNSNIDRKTVESFGNEWTKFNHFNNQEIEDIASMHYFDIVKPEWITNKQILDVGCGTGRWTKYTSKFAATVDAVDPSVAIESAALLLANCNNVRLSRASINNLPFADKCFDFVFSLGVLHHVPDTVLAMKECVAKIRPGGYFLVYMYYDLDNRGWLFKSIFFFSDLIRQFVAKLPVWAKNFCCDLIAITV